MSPDLHGISAVGALLSLLVIGSLLGGATVAGCRNGRANDEADRARPPERKPAEEPLPPPEMKTEELNRERVDVPPGLAELRPTAELAAGEPRLIYNALGPLRLRVVRADQPGVAVAEVDAEAGQVFVVDREKGIRLGSQEVRGGPLDEETVYQLYAFPVDGVQSEASRTLTRPQTEAERRAVAEERKRQAEAAATQPGARHTTPTTSPAFGGDG